MKAPRVPEPSSRVMTVISWSRSKSVAAASVEAASLEAASLEAVLSEAAEEASPALEAVLPQFAGEIDQIPPMYSAVKINGKKLYELARKGKEVERKPRRITMYSLEVEGQDCGRDFTLRVRCSKGTYVRTLCHDIGQALGCGGCMSSLRRTMAAGYTLADAVTLDQVTQAADPSRLLRPVDSCFAHLPALTLTAAQAKRVRSGAAFTFPREGTWLCTALRESFWLSAAVRMGSCGP